MKGPETMRAFVFKGEKQVGFAKKPIPEPGSVTESKSTVDLGIVFINK